MSGKSTKSTKNTTRQVNKNLSNDEANQIFVRNFMKVARKEVEIVGSPVNVVADLCKAEGYVINPGTVSVKAAALRKRLKEQKGIDLPGLPRGSSGGGGKSLNIDALGDIVSAKVDSSSPADETAVDETAD